VESVNDASDVDNAPSKCKICSGSNLEYIGSKTGTVNSTAFQLYRCKSCGFAFISNPCLDYGLLYSEKYYRGEGADHLVDYVYELDHPDKTIRQYEWRGILKAVRSLTAVGPETKWLDFGCGNGALVRYVRQKAGCGIVGYEQGWIKSKAAALGIPILSERELDPLKGTFDIVTAIEVLEHTVDPVAELHTIRTLLKPGGLFFYTTGNAYPHRDKLCQWGYLMPDIHISLFEPGSLRIALQACGFRPEHRGFVPGFEDIIRFKVLKTLGRRRSALGERILPWKQISRLVDARLQVTGHPIGWATEND
jgi:2-polyprenyl-3-methyl-5-hydroxy-6-metoxy-1,4-benzoquinol methylase